MSLNRYAKKVDSTQEEIVSILRSLGYSVVILGKPVDLMVRRSTWPANTWKLLEVKTPTKSGSIILDKRQREQIAFCADFDVPKVTTAQQALDYLNAR